MKKVVLLAGLIAVTACAETLPPPTPVAQTLPPKIGFTVQSINLTDRSGLQPSASPYNGNHFSPTIADAIKQWASDRLQATGGSGQAIVVIKDATLMSQPLPMEKGISGWFTRQQAEKYTGRADVTIEANGPQGFASTDATAVRSVSLPENATPLERQDAYYTLLNGLMKDLGQNLDAGIQTHMGSFLANPPTTSMIGAPSQVSSLAVNESQQPVIIDGQAAPSAMAMPAPTSYAHPSSVTSAAPMPAANTASVGPVFGSHAIPYAPTQQSAAAPPLSIVPQTTMPNYGQAAQQNNQIQSAPVQPMPVSQQDDSTPHHYQPTDQPYQSTAPLYQPAPPAPQPTPMAAPSQPITIPLSGSYGR